MSLLRVLFVEDSEQDAELLVRELRRAGYELNFERVYAREALANALDRETWDVILADHTMPHFRGTEALAMVREKGLDVPFIFVSGTIGEDAAVDAMKAGANDYVIKGNLKRLIPAVERELRDAAVRRERRQLEAQLQQAQRLEAVGRLAGGVAHDFNNILTVIMGEAQLALLDAHLDHKLQQSLKDIQKAGDQARMLTRQLLAFSRREVVEPTVFDVNDLIRGMGTMLRRLISEDIELLTQASTDPCMVRADRGRIEQVVANLVVNACDATATGGRLIIATSNVALDDADRATHGDSPAGAYVVLAVSDTGTGMTDEVKQHLFEPFFTTKDREKGTGLGLATSYGIVTQAGGHIGVYSAPGMGTTMKVYLPCVSAAVADSEQEEPTVVGGDETILLVEDDDDVRRTAIRMLEAQGYHLIATGDPTEALELAAQHPGPIHLLLTDVVLRKASGRELAEQIRAERPSIAVLFASGYTDDVILRHRVLERGAHFVEKPFAGGTLARKVREALGA